MATGLAARDAVREVRGAVLDAAPQADAQAVRRVGQDAGEDMTTDPTLEWDDHLHEIIIYHRGEWRRRTDPQLPRYMKERIDAAYQHVEDPKRNPWPEDE